MVGPRTEFDEVLTLCADQHRRIVLAVLAGEERSLTMRDLRSAILTYNHQQPVTAASPEKLHEISVSLHHVHIPKLESAGFVEYDRERGLVKPTAQIDQWQPSVSTIIDADPGLEAPVEL